MDMRDVGMRDASKREDEIFRALAHPTRRAMLKRLSLGPVSPSSLARPFNMSIQAVLQHLELLEGAGLVFSVHERGLRVCRLELEPLSSVIRSYVDAISSPCIG